MDANCLQSKNIPGDHGVQSCTPMDANCLQSKNIPGDHGVQSCTPMDAKKGATKLLPRRHCRLQSEIILVTNGYRDGNHNDQSENIFF